MPKSSKIVLLAVSVALVLMIFVGVNSSGVSAASEDQEGAYRQINVYSEVLQHIQSDYVTDPNITTVTNGALRGLLESLDADSSYLTAADYKIYKADVNRAGKAQVGLNVSKRYGYATVVSVVPGSPADKANLVDGDILEAIAGQDTRNISLAMIQLMLEGQPGTEVTVSVVRPRRAEPEKVVLTRTAAQVPAVQDTMYDGSSILYLKPEILDHEHVQQVEAKLKGMSRAGNKKVLLDLRDVAAGDMTEAARLANFFLKSGTIGSLEGQRFEKVTFTADPSKAIAPTAPIVVLVNHGTAGPAELVAGALLDDKRAELVGEHTFGEGAQQKTIELPDGGALILSVAKYESPSGKKLQDDGVAPNVEVASAVPDEEQAPVEQLGPGTAQGTTAPLKKPTATVDDQLNKALDLLKSKAA
ncbi:MAG TPA: S41 family peptidase [Granulicella sp.]|nr:S41 family peptidase [Granulicella sp.]